jgi:myo-inositol-1(or 4)-monophosphatase
MAVFDIRSAEKFIQSTARTAGRAVLKRFGTEGVHYMKSENMWDVVTKADLISEKIIITAICKAYPGHGIIAEETGVLNEEAEYVWVIDPIDGTLNYSRGVPLFGVMMCLVHRGEILLSAINLPAEGQLFFARKGRGTYLNGKRIHCSDRASLDQSFGAGSARLDGRPAAFIENLLRSARKEKIQFASFFSMAVNACYVASGRRDWMAPLAGALWDFAPAYLILKESGCRVTDTKGNPWKFGMLEMVAANPRLHTKLLRLTKGI